METVTDSIRGSGSSLDVEITKEHPGQNDVDASGPIPRHEAATE